MVIRTYFDKNNTIVRNCEINTGLNPVGELFYGGAIGEQQFSRFIFHFDEARLKDMYSGGTFTDLTKLKHTLRMTNTGFLDPSLLNTTLGAKDRTSSFNLILFKLEQDWDNGVGYDYTFCGSLLNDGGLDKPTISYSPSNWFESQTGVEWANGSGIFTGSTSGITIGTQHFDKGNENIEIDITNYVNGLLTGDTNYGLGIAFESSFEAIETDRLNYVGFFTNNTQTFYEPYVESIYSNHIVDDRNNFFLDKPNKLYLYVNVAGNPVNLDTLPTVTIFDSSNTPISAYTSSEINHVTKGVYSIDILIPTTNTNIESMYYDEWSGISINGVNRPNIELQFVVKNSFEYYSIGNSDSIPKKVALNISGLKNGEIIKRGDIRKVSVSARIPYTVEQTQTISDLKYRIYVTEGNRELTVIDFQPIEITNRNYYFLIDTASLLPNTYYLDVLVTSNLETTTLKNVCKFSILSQIELRNSQ